VSTKKEGEDEDDEEREYVDDLGNEQWKRERGITDDTVVMDQSAGLFAQGTYDKHKNSQAQNQNRFKMPSRPYNKYKGPKARKSKGPVRYSINEIRKSMGVMGGTNRVTGEEARKFKRTHKTVPIWRPSGFSSKFDKEK